MVRWAKKPNKKHGFTIVELLIVIIVIAILAAITIVAYNGIQTRAENTKTITAVSSYVKAIKLYASDQGSYPIPASNYPCLGKAAFCANVTDTTGSCDGSGRAPNASILNAALTSVATSLPEPSTQSMDCGGKLYSGAYYTYGNSGKSANIRMYLRGNIDCPAISGTTSASRFQANDTTSCAAALPNL